MLVAFVIVWGALGVVRHRSRIDLPELPTSGGSWREDNRRVDNGGQAMKLFLAQWRVVKTTLGSDIGNAPRENTA